MSCFENKEAKKEEKITWVFFFFRIICFKGYHNRPGILLPGFHSDDTNMPQVRNESNFISQPTPNTGYHTQHTLFCWIFIISSRCILCPFHRLDSGSAHFSSCMAHIFPGPTTLEYFPIESQFPGLPATKWPDMEVTWTLINISH